MTSPRILVFSASTRRESLNSKLISVAAERLRFHGADVSLLDFARFPMPIYDGDVESSEGVPQEAAALHEALRSHHGVFIASPEYNSGPPPVLVNAFTWVSRYAAEGGIAAAFRRPVFALGAASPGAFGGYRGLSQLRQWLELGFGACVLPSMVSVPAAHEAFDGNGALLNPRSASALDQVILDLLQSVRHRSES